MKQFLKSGRSVLTRRHHCIAPNRDNYSTSSTPKNTSAEQSPEPTLKEPPKDPADSKDHKAEDHQAAKSPAKTQVQLDEELRQKMSGLSGEGGESGVEYEDGQPVSMKRAHQQSKSDDMEAHRAPLAPLAGHFKLKRN
ncbi:hypothetical protein MMC25_001449 [Agyrium rufum]|nr:hypothetical protein [Agyrium rufum]